MILTDLEITSHQPFIRDICNRETFHLCHLFLKQLGKFKTPKTGKHVIILEQEGADLHVAKKRDFAYELLGLNEYYTNFDYRTYEESDIQTKKKVIWNTIYSSLMITGKQLGWNIAMIDAAFKAGLALHLENRFTHIESLASKDKSLFASIIAHFDFYSFKAYLVVKDKSQATIFEKKIMDRQPNWGWYDFPNYKFAKWTGPREFTFGHKDGDISNRTYNL